MPAQPVASCELESDQKVNIYVIRVKKGKNWFAIVDNHLRLITHRTILIQLNNSPFVLEYEEKTQVLRERF